MSGEWRFNAGREERGRVAGWGSWGVSGWGVGGKRSGWQAVGEEGARIMWEVADECLGEGVGVLRFWEGASEVPRYGGQNKQPANCDGSSGHCHEED